MFGGRFQQLAQYINNNNNNNNNARVFEIL